MELRESTVRNHLQIALCAVLSAAAPAQGLAVEAFTTPDGSRFLLAADPAAPPLVHWAVGALHATDLDPPGALGLSRSVLRASLAGTWQHGSLDAASEAKTLEALDQLLAQTWRDHGHPSSWPEAVRARVEPAREAVRALGDPTAWRRAVVSIPATEPLVIEEGGTTVLAVTTAAHTLPRLATLVLDWRENVTLRSFHDVWQDTVADLAAQSASPDGRLRREVLGSTFLGSAAARGIDPRASFVPSAEARQQFARVAHPLRTVHVLAGGFDPNEVKGLLAKVFRFTMLPTPTLPNPMRPAEARERRSVLPSPDGERGVALAWPIPDDVTPVEIDAITALLDGTSFSFLPRWAAELGDIRFRVVAPFPRNARPGLLLVEAFADGPDGVRADELERSLVDNLAGLPDQLRDFQCKQAGEIAIGRRVLATSDRSDLAVSLAVGTLAEGRSPGEVLGLGEAPGSARVRQLADRFFRTRPGTVVVLGPAQ
jgi:predicted Zn-dependent peptidase